MTGLPSTTCRVKRVFGSSPSAVGELLSATYRSRVPFPSTSPKAIVVAPYFHTSPRSVASSKRPFPSFKNNRVPPPIELTSRSRSPSPSTSANTVPVEYCPAQRTPAWSVMSSKCQAPRFRYSRFPPSIPQKYKSHQPSESTSPAATPDPANRSWLLRPLSCERTLLNRIPELEPGTRVKPFRPSLGIDNAALRYPGPFSQ